MMMPLQPQRPQEVRATPAWNYQQPVHAAPAPTMTQLSGGNVGNCRLAMPPQQPRHIAAPCQQVAYRAPGQLQQVPQPTHQVPQPAQQMPRPMQQVPQPTMPTAYAGTHVAPVAPNVWTAPQQCATAPVYAQHAHGYIIYPGQHQAPSNRGVILYGAPSTLAVDSNSGVQRQSSPQQPGLVSHAVAQMAPVVDGISDVQSSPYPLQLPVASQDPPGMQALDPSQISGEREQSIISASPVNVVPMPAKVISALPYQTAGSPMNNFGFSASPNARRRYNTLESLRSPNLNGSFVSLPSPALNGGFWGRGMADYNRYEGMQKALWEYNNEIFDQRNLFQYIFDESICCFDEEVCPGVTGFVAFTIDDAPGRLGPKKTLIPELRELLKKYDAKVSFFMMSDYVKGHEKRLKKLIKDGCELQNHGQRDISYYWYSEDEFEEALHDSADVLSKFEQASSHRRYYRAPKGMMSQAMKDVLQREGYKNVMFDRYALDTEVGDPTWLSERLLDRVESGSVLLIHMPEQGFREWNLQAIELTLQGLQERGLKAVTVSELAAKAEIEIEPSPNGLSGTGLSPSILRTQGVQSGSPAALLRKSSLSPGNAGSLQLPRGALPQAAPCHSSAGAPQASSAQEASKEEPTSRNAKPRQATQEASPLPKRRAKKCCM